MSASKTILAVSIIFIAGLVTGGALAWKYAGRALQKGDAASESSTFQPWQLKDKYVKYLAKKLDLDATQEEAIAKIVTESQHRTKILFELVAPEMQEEMRQVRDSIRAVLSPAQQAEFEDIQNRHSRRHKDDDANRSNKDNDGQDASDDDAVNQGAPTIRGKCQNQYLWDNPYWLPSASSCLSG